MSLFELYRIRIKDMMSMITISLETNYIHEGYYYVRCFYVTVTVRSITIITNYVGMTGVLSPQVDI
jgi:hypothetical protein